MGETLLSQSVLKRRRRNFNKVTLKETLRINVMTLKDQCVDVWKKTKTVRVRDVDHTVYLPVSQGKYRIVRWQ